MGSMELIVQLATVVSAIVAATSLVFSYCDNRKKRIQKLNEDTIEAYGKIQSDVLDKFAPISKDEVIDFINNYSDTPEEKEIYNGYRVLLARLEHFAVGVNCGAYSIKIVDQLGGIHLIFLIQKLMPVIDKSIENSSIKEGMYSHILELYEELKNIHQNVGENQK